MVRTLLASFFPTLLLLFFLSLFFLFYFITYWAINIFFIDIQFYAFMTTVTDLNKTKIYRLFAMLDVDRSGLIDFNEFYILVCILLAVRVSWLGIHTMIRRLFNRCIQAQNYISEL